LSVRVAVLVSGSGTILEAIVAAGVPVALVVADRPCRGIAVAESASVAATVLDRHEFGGFGPTFDRDEYSAALAALLREAAIDVVAMAGFGTILTGSLHDAFPGRVLNTHPSLLPAFKGWHAVADALAAGVSETGCTVHVATEALDDGPLLAQVVVPIAADDDESSLHERIKAVERELYPAVLTRVIATVAAGREPDSLAVTPQGD
jgi:phosphoribosylglycinamide formyltransferase-1